MLGSLDTERRSHLAIQDWMAFSLDVQPAREDEWDRAAIVPWSCSVTVNALRFCARCHWRCHEPLRVVGLLPQLLRKPESPGKWSIGQILQHSRGRLIDVNYFYRTGNFNCR